MEAEGSGAYVEAAGTRQGMNARRDGQPLRPDNVQPAGKPVSEEALLKKYAKGNAPAQAPSDLQFHGTSGGREASKFVGLRQRQRARRRGTIASTMPRIEAIPETSDAPLTPVLFSAGWRA
jgi:hypothetical protein